MPSFETKFIATILGILITASLVGMETGNNWWGITTAIGMSTIVIGDHL